METLTGPVVAVGSGNPAKVRAVEHALRRVWPNVRVLPAEVESGVSKMPLSDDEMLLGAGNRAHNALAAHSEADYGIGLEGGVHTMAVDADSTVMLLGGWAVVERRDGQRGVGACARLPLPETIAKCVRDGEELGPVMDRVTKSTDVKKKGGAVGVLV